MNADPKQRVQYFPFGNQLRIEAQTARGMGTERVEVRFDADQFMRVCAQEPLLRAAMLRAMADLAEAAWKQEVITITIHDQVVVT